MKLKVNQMNLAFHKQNGVNANEQSIHRNMRPIFFAKSRATVPPAESTA
jgi:hypothetical protein